ncbi:MAG: hypothetical protein VR64_14625 [Desulfatitalea sp. BRH_c12]|jgi:hypothetical protein|nr:MAG: hypothetical protein VR64_14625 [Desulfatitalea sp. BRH_c12]
MMIATFYKSGYQLFKTKKASYLPCLCCVSELQKLPSLFSDAGTCYVFNAYFSNEFDIEFIFDDENDAIVARGDLIFQMIDYWGPHQVIFSNGFDYDVTVVAAIQEVTDVFEKDQRAGFAILVSDLPYPLHLVFRNFAAAQLFHQIVIGRLERYRQENAMHKGRAVMNE